MSNVSNPSPKSRFSIPEESDVAFSRFRNAGDIGAFSDLVHDLRKELLHSIKQFVPDEHRAEDALQEAWSQVYLKAESFNPSYRFRAWVHTIARNKAIDSARKVKGKNAFSLNVRDQNELSKSGLLPTTKHDPADIVQQEEQAGEIRQLVAQLPDRMRVPITLVYFHGMKYREAAESMDVPLGTVKSRIAAGLRRLEELLLAEDSN